MRACKSFGVGRMVCVTLVPPHTEMATEELRAALDIIIRYGQWTLLVFG